MFKNELDEAGFSLIELAVSAALLLVVTVMAGSYYTAAADKIKADIEAVKDMQAGSSEVFLFTFK